VDWTDYNIIDDTVVSVSKIASAVTAHGASMLPTLCIIGGAVVGIAVVWRIIRTIKRGVGNAG
jgi:hypothetical protein